MLDLTAERFEKYGKLIDWAARRYAQKVPHSYPGIEEFIGEGHEVLVTCNQKWDERGDEVAFGKFFKTSLFHKFQDILVREYSKKRGTYMSPVDPDEVTYYREESIEDAYKAYRDKPGERNPLVTEEFSEVLYGELVEHVKSKIDSSLEKKIFAILVDPPEELCKMAVDQNRRKMKLSMSKHCKGTNVVKITSKLIIEYLNAKGDRVDENAFYASRRNIRRIVLETLKEG